MKSSNSSKDEQKNKKSNSDDKIHRMSEALRQNLRKRKEFQRKQKEETK